MSPPEPLTSPTTFSSFRSRIGCGSKRLLHSLLLLLCCLVFPAQAEGAKAISFVYSDIDGRPVRLADYQGKWVLVNFWAPWCPLCKIQIPNLNKLNQRPDFRVIGIALEYGDESAIRDAIKSSSIRFDAIIAGGARRDRDGAQRQIGPVDFFPTSYLYDPEGEIVMFIPGQMRMPRILSFMEQWQAEHGATRQALLAAKTEKLAASLRQRFGERGGQAFADWKKALETALPLAPSQKLARVNEFFNQRIQAADDRAIWNRDDYWASPGDLLGAGRGDGEDFAIAKYFSLMAVNIPPERMRLVYVRSRGETKASPVHMVLAWYEAAGKEPLILDNRVTEILPASRRTDLQPVYSFNSLGVWEETAAAAASGDPGRLAIWEDALRRARGEGFE